MSLHRNKNLTKTITVNYFVYFWISDIITIIEILFYQHLCSLVQRKQVFLRRGAKVLREAPGAWLPHKWLTALEQAFNEGGWLVHFTFRSLPCLTVLVYSYFINTKLFFLDMFQILTHQTHLFNHYHVVTDLNIAIIFFAMIILYLNLLIPSVCFHL